MATAKINGIDIYYEEHGDSGAEPVVLIMGFMTNMGAWAGQIPALKERYRVLAFDNRGCGRSSHPAEPYTMAQFVSDTAALMDDRGLGAAHIVGASMGGMIAQHFALTHPGRTRTLTLMCTTPGGPHSAGYGELMSYAGELETAKDAASLMTPERLQEGLAATFSAAYLAKPDELFVQTSIATVQYPATMEGMRGQFAAIQGHDTYDDLPKIAAPTLVMTGDADGLVPSENSNILAERIPDATLKLYPGLGHGFNIEGAARVNADLLAFLSAHARVGAEA
jgi:pimeloyl-ACP methyl ester carboxylesterase